MPCLAQKEYILMKRWTLNAFDVVIFHLIRLKSNDASKLKGIVIIVLIMEQEIAAHWHPVVAWP